MASSVGQRPLGRLVEPGPPVTGSARSHQLNKAEVLPGVPSVRGGQDLNLAQPAPNLERLGQFFLTMASQAVCRSAQPRHRRRTWKTTSLMHDHRQTFVLKM